MCPSSETARSPDDNVKSKIVTRALWDPSQLHRTVSLRLAMSIMEKHRYLAWPTYVVAFSLSIIPPFDALMQVLPTHPGDPRWRFGFFGLMSNALMLPLVGLLLAFVGASYFEHRRFQKILGAIACLIAVATLAMLGLFALDALQVRGQVKATASLAYNVTALSAAMKALIGIVSLGAFGVAALKAPKIKRQPSRGAGVVIGTQKSSRPPAGTATPSLGSPAVSES